MTSSNTNKNPAFLKYVYELNEGNNLSEALQLSWTQLNKLDILKLQKIGLKTYAKGKWSIHKIIQHLIDWERIWCYRAILFARGEGTIPVAHDQEIMGAQANADELSLNQLIDELKIVRQSTLMMFSSFNKKILETPCVFFEYEMTLYDIGLTITAHQIHHFNIIKERYLPLESN